MTNMRYFPKRPFPPYAFIPGQNPHPEKKGGHMYGEEHNCSALTGNGEDNSFITNSDYLYAFDLFNEGYYWESHVWWEELWHLAGRKGDCADLLKALIKLAAAGVKLKLEHREPAHGHIERACELIDQIAPRYSTPFYGVNLKQLSNDIKELIENPDELIRYRLTLENIADIL